MSEFPPEPSEDDRSPPGNTRREFMKKIGGITAGIASVANVENSPQRREAIKQAMTFCAPEGTPPKKWTVLGRYYDPTLPGALTYFIPIRDENWEIRMLMITETHAAVRFFSGLRPNDIIAFKCKDDKPFLNHDIDVPFADRDKRELFLVPYYAEK